MKISIDVKNRSEGNRIKTALEDPATRAMVNVTGALLRLDTFDLDALHWRSAEDLEGRESCLCISCVQARRR